VLTALAPAPVVFLVLFLVVSPISKLVFPSEAKSVGSVEIRGGTPVVMIVFDELWSAPLMDARRRIDARRYPSLARLASDATWYRNATTVADGTPHAAPALLTGRRPNRDALPITADYPGNLFTLLGDDYAFEVIEPVTDLCPAHLCGEATRDPTSERLSDLVSDLSVVSLHLLLPDSLRDGLPAVDRTFGDFREKRPARPATERGAPDEPTFRVVHRLALEDRVRQLGDFERSLGRRSKRPVLHYLHVQLPHLAYRYLPSGQQYTVRSQDPPGLRSERWSADPWLVQQAFQRYMLQVGYVDRFVGRVVDRLRAAGLYDRSLIVVTSDHGVGFTPGAPRRAITRRTFAQIAGVPMIVKGPGQRKARIDDSSVSTIDLLPTIADHLDVDLPWTTDGRSALASSRQRPDRLEVLSHGGGSVEMAFSDFKRLRDADLDRMLASFSSLEVDDGIFRVGTDADLVGKSLDSLSPGPDRGARIELDSPGLYSSVDPTDAVVPAFISGRFVDGGVRGQRLAVALNGRVGATTRAHQSRGEIRFGAMIAPSALRRGRNTVDVAAISGAGATRRFAALGQPVGRLARESYDLVKRNGREMLLTAAGAALHVRRKAAVGVYENISLDYESGRLAVDGWAAGAERGVADRVVVFVDGRFIVAGRPSRVRSDVAELLGQDARNAGFALIGRIDPDSEVDRRSGARVFAIVGNRATELERARR
jgi:hypothetical protein